MNTDGKRTHDVQPVHASDTFLTLEVLEPRLLLAALTVDSLADTVAIDGVVTLREAIIAANTDTATELGQWGYGPDSISFSPALFGGVPQVLTLTMGEMAITSDLDILGYGPTNFLTIDAGGASRIFNVDDYSGALINAYMVGFTMTGGAETNGGAIYSKEDLHLFACDVNGSNAQNGGAIYSDGGQLILEWSTVTGNNAALDGGAVYLNNSWASVMGSSITFNNAGSDGGGIYASGGLLDIYGGWSGAPTTISGNSAQGNGGGIYASGSALDIYGGWYGPAATISGNTAQGDGGGIYATNGSLDIYSGWYGSGATISGNSAEGDGGGVYASGTALDIYAGWYGWGTTINSNWAEGDGGGICVIGGEGSIRDAEVSWNTAANGGGIYASGAEMDIDYSNVHHNDADYGGGIYANGGETELWESRVADNTATFDGGGIAAYYGSLHMDGEGGSIVTANTAGGEGGPGDGGGIALIGAEGEIDDTEISWNSATNDGGGIYAVGAEGSSLGIYYGVTISNNAAGGDGGGIYALGAEGSWLDIYYGVTISNNTALGNGGGICAIGGGGWLFDAELDNNTASGDGGGVYAFGAEMFLMYCNIHDNDAANGGGIYADGGETIVSRGNVTANTATDQGGGIMAYYGLLYMGGEGSIVTGNTAGAGGSSEGGGIALIGAEGYIWDTEISWNSAPNGGGVYALGLMYGFIEGCNIHNNDADYGGGVFVDGGEMGFWYTTFESNSAVFDGGGIAAYNCELWGAEGNITLNVAGGEGGGIYMSGGEGYVVYYTSIAGNSATNEGGGVYTENGTLHMYDTLVEFNYASNGAGISARNALNLDVGEGSVIQNNSAIGGSGGGLYIDGGDATLHRADVLNNVATMGAGGGIYVSYGILDIDQSIVQGNSAPGGFGGGIYSFGGDIAVTDSLIAGNDSEAGGGIFGDGAGYVSIEGSTISGNIAVGGMMMMGQGGGIFNDWASSLVIFSSTISGNVADVDPMMGGGGGGLENRGAASIYNSTIVNNLAASMMPFTGEGGGIHQTGTLTMESTIVANNAAGGFGQDIMGVVTADYSLIEDPVGATIIETVPGSNIFWLDPNLDVLADYGGLTPTHALLPGSPALDMGSNPLALGQDQRGLPFVREYGQADIGAYETQPLNLVVDIWWDEDDGDYGPGDLALREAVGLANINPGADAIGFDPLLAGDTLNLWDGELVITESVTITGLGADQLTVDADDDSRVFNVNDGLPDGPDEVVIISGLTLYDGWVGAADGGIISNWEDLTLIDCVLTEGWADNGGAIFNGGLMSIQGTTVDDNEATMSGGGIANTGSLTIQNSTISDNTAWGNGGGIHNNNGDLDVINSTISGNEANGDGGGIAFVQFIPALTRVYNSTIANNTSLLGNGGGVWTNAVDFMIESTIIADNVAMGVAPDMWGTVFADFSLIGDPTGATIIGGSNQIGVDPLLGPLADNGGPTMTHSLGFGSPAVNTGSNPLALLTEQRGVGYDRVRYGQADMGAYEAEGIVVWQWISDNGHVIVTAYDMLGDLDIDPNDITVIFGLNDRVNTIRFAGSQAMEGLAFTIAGATWTGSVIDGRLGDRGALSFVASDSGIGSFRVRADVVGYDLNGWDFCSLVLPADVDGDLLLDDLTSLYGDGNLNSVIVYGDILGDVVSGGKIGTVAAYSALDRVLRDWQGGNIAGDVQAVGDVRVVNAMGGDIDGNVISLAGSVFNVRALAKLDPDDRVWVGGSIAGDVLAAGNISYVYAGGGNVTGSIMCMGRLGSVVGRHSYDYGLRQYVNGDITGDLWGGSIGTINAMGDFSSLVSSINTLNVISVRGNMTGARVQVGGRLNTVSVLGNFHNSNIFAGELGSVIVRGDVTEDAGDGEDQINARSGRFRMQGRGVWRWISEDYEREWGGVRCWVGTPPP